MLAYASAHCYFVYHVCARLDHIATEPCCSSACIENTATPSLTWLSGHADLQGGTFRAGDSKSVRQDDHSHQPEAPVQGMRRSQRQRQLKDKQLLAEAQHTDRLRTATVTVATPSSSREASRTMPCTVYTAGRTRESSASVKVLCSTEKKPQLQKQQQLEQQRQRGLAQGSAGQAAVGNVAIGRKGKSSPTAGVKKQTSPVGKGLVGGPALGGRFPLRVRRNAEQPSIMNDLNSKFVQSRGLGNIASHVAAP